MRSVLTALMATAALTLAACGDDADKDASATPTPAAEAASTPEASTPESSPEASTEEASADVKQGVCSDVEQPEPKDTDTPEPKGSLDASKKNLITLKTSCGTIVIELAAKEYPKTANAVATLVKNGYWDNTSFHRVVPGFVIQGGDPTASGSGGPDWKVVEAPKSTEKYPKGTLAMAKTGMDEPGTTQSQFFIMTGDGLDPQYAVAGRVVKGLDAALAADKLGQGDGPPSKPIVLFKATFKAE